MPTRPVNKSGRAHLIDATRGVGWTVGIALAVMAIGLGIITLITALFAGS